MTPLRQGLALVASLSLGTLGTLGLAAVASTSSARTADDPCVGRGPVPARAVAGLSSSGCALAGRVVRAGRAAVVVPPAGYTVSGEGVGAHGEVGLRVVNTGSVVRATTFGAPSRPAAARVSSPPACRDRTFHLEPGALPWVAPMRYRANLSNLPAGYAAKTVIRQVKAANGNMRKGRNTCGKPRLGTPPSHFLGRTHARPSITTGPASVTCGSFDTDNVVAFGALPGGLVGWTCNWWSGSPHISAFDIMMDTGPELTTHLPPNCVNEWDFEGSLTHEFGHAYGMAHTGSGHANLTMQHELTTCSTYARTLGLGDWLGMKKMYGKR